MILPAMRGRLGDSVGWLMSQKRAASIELTAQVFLGNLTTNYYSLPIQSTMLQSPYLID